MYNSQGGCLYHNPEKGKMLLLKAIMAFEFVITPETNYPKHPCLSEKPLTKECMIRHFVYLPLVHIIVIFNQAIISFISLKPASLDGAKSHILPLCHVILPTIVWSCIHKFLLNTQVKNRVSPTREQNYF